jgi:hypothetical protein
MGRLVGDATPNVAKELGKGMFFNADQLFCAISHDDVVIRD